MVHVACMDEKCKRVVHLCSPIHWNFEGVVKCPTCGRSMKIEIKKGKVVSIKPLLGKRACA